MKKSLYICIVILFLCLASFVSAQVPGDVNSDGDVNIIDALLLLQYLNGLSVSGLDLSVADMNADGKVSYVDALIITHIYVIGHPPVPGPQDTSPGTGQITLSTLPYQPHLPNQIFYIQVHLDIGFQPFAALSLNLNYDPGFLEFISAEFPSNFTATAVSSGNNLLIQGMIFEQSLLSDYLHIANLQFRALSPVDDYRLSLNINEFIDYTTAPVGNPEGIIAPIRIIDAMFGDVNEDLKVNIVDALIVAQAYVSSATLQVEERVADVNNDRKVTIVDALIIAQYYVGIIDQFPVETYTPGPVPAIATS